ncbi:MAG: phosphoglucomutase/phosphomannomutase family protein [Chloroflexi bacterium]|nr:phosphoglucomutase/phosphomannomutase family protein [Chloroflexota bacterium]
MGTAREATLRFGTDGWRAVIAEDFTFANLQRVAQAVAHHLREQNETAADLQVVVGYDTRFLSDRFAAEVSCVLAGNGIVAWLTRSDAPTPSISHNVRARGAAAGIIITASHNPPRYNGFKLKLPSGAAATRAEIMGIETALRADSLPIQRMDYGEALRRGLIQRFDPGWGYYEHLGTLVDLDAISDGELRVVVDAMWGAGRHALPAVLSRTRSQVLEIRNALNPGFGGVHPEPILRYLNELVAAVQRERAQIGLAMDGDADRIGAIDAQGEFVSPQLIMALALQHLVESRGQSGTVVKTVSTTMLLDRLARKHDLPLHETPIGFNHIAEWMLRENVLLGGEESGGISIQGHIPEGDGILMGLILLEILALGRAPLHEQIADLQREYGPAHYDRHDAVLDRVLPRETWQRRLTDAAPARLVGETLHSLDTQDGVKFRLADGGWLLIRPSGTEPVLRIYAEAPDPKALAALLEEGAALGEAVLQKESGGDA